MKTYHGLRLPTVGARVIVEAQGKIHCLLDPRLDLRCHSPTGMEWGYGGSGPAQLALALLADATGDDVYAVARYMDYKCEVVANIPSGPEAGATEGCWHITQAEIQAWAAANPCTEADRCWVQAEFQAKRELQLQREGDRKEATRWSRG